MKDFIELCHNRFSARKFTNESIAQTDLEYIQEAVRLAPSATNSQPWRFIVVSSPSAQQHLQECYNRDWFKTAPLYIICMKHAEQAWKQPADGKNHGDIDVAIAIEHLCLAATERGLGTCWVCNFDPNLLSQYFPCNGYEAVAIIAIGHTSADCLHPEKKRKRIDEIFETR